MSISNIAKLIIALFSLFGGFLLNIMPPLAFSGFINGFVQMICLLIAIFVIKKNKSGKFFLKKMFIRSSIAFVLLGFLYFWQYSITIVSFKDEKIIKGSQLTQLAIDNCKASAANVVFRLDECEKNAINTFQQYSHYTKYNVWQNFLFNEIKMMAFYISMISALVIAVFSGIDYQQIIK